MRFAIPQWQGRVSPVFDSAREALLVDAAEGQRASRRVIRLGGQGPMGRARALQRLGVRVLICGAVSRPVEAALVGAGIRVIRNTCGSVEDVLSAFLSGRLKEPSFFMPGVPHRCREAPGGPRLRL